MKKGQIMQKIELGKAAKVPMILLEDAHRVFSEMKGVDVLIIPDNSGGECRLVTQSPEFVEFFEDVMSGVQAT